jgi:hypothetical protein
LKSAYKEEIVGYSFPTGYTVNWLAGEDGKQMHDIILQKFEGPFLWNDWHKNEVRLKNMLDSIEGEFKKLDKRTGVYNKVGFIVDVSHIDLSLIKPLSILPQTASAQNFIHPRAGDTAVVGWDRGFSSFSSAMVGLMLDIFVKAYPFLSHKVFRVKSYAEARSVLKYQY